MEAERSIIKKFRKELWSKFIKAINEFDLIEENDKIAVCISGGKDSFLLAKCMQELQKHGKFHFDLEFIVMDPGYNDVNRKLIMDNAKLLNIPITIFNADIFKYVTSLENGSPCYLCARMRRGNLYNKAKELGCNKIALGHHYNDVIETVLLSMFYGGEIKTMMPKLHSSNYEGMELIRPLYFVREDAIIDWKNYNHLRFLNCACKFTEEVSKNENNSKRLEMKLLIKKLSETNQFIDSNIYKSICNVNLDAIIGYQVKNEKHNFMDNYKD